MAYINAVWAVCVTIFSTGGKFRLVLNFIELHPLTLVAHFYVGIMPCGPMIRYLTTSQVQILAAFFSSRIPTIKYPLDIKKFTPSLLSSSLPVMLMLRLSIEIYQTRGHLMCLTTTPTIPPLGTMAQPTSAYLPQMAKLSLSHRKIPTCT